MDDEEPGIQNVRHCKFITTSKETNILAENDLN